MSKITRISLYMMTAISVAGCAGMLSIPDEHQLVSSYHSGTQDTVRRRCDFSTGFDRAGEKSAQPGLNPEAIRLLNWNVYKGTSDNWQADFKRLSRDSDIVALQEAQLHKDFISGLKQGNLHWDLTTAFTYDDAQTGVLIASNVKPAAICALHAEEPIISIPKSALVTEYRIQGMGQTLLVANVHMINFSFGTAEYGEQLSQLREVLVNHRGALIVTGDFNTWSDERMAIMRRMAEDLELKAVEYDRDFRMTIFGNALDHVYYRGLEAGKADMERVESSDHNPVKVIFRIAGL